MSCSRSVNLTRGSSGSYLDLSLAWCWLCFPGGAVSSCNAQLLRFYFEYYGVFPPHGPSISAYITLATWFLSWTSSNCCWKKAHWNTFELLSLYWGTLKECAISLSVLCWTWPLLPQKDMGGSPPLVQDGFGIKLKWPVSWGKNQVKKWLWLLC